jgi:hypothetical protein
MDGLRCCFYSAPERSYLIKTYVQHIDDSVQPQADFHSPKLFGDIVASITPCDFIIGILFFSII